MSIPTTSGVVQSDGLNIAYRAVGSGAPILLAHGWGTDAQSNWEATGWADVLAPYRQIVMLDVRGHGLSDKPLDIGAYKYAAMSRDVLAVLDALGIERCDFMGYSMGAFMGAWLLGHHGGRFTSMILGGIGNETSDSAAAGAAIADALRAPSLAAVRDPMARAVRAFVEDNPRSDLLALACSAESMWPDGYPLQLLGNGAQTSTLPVLIVNGSNDHPYVDSADALAAALPNATHVQLPGADHLSAVTDTRFKSLVIEFLGKQSDAANR